MEVPEGARQAAEQVRVEVQVTAHLHVPERRWKPSELVSVQVEAAIESDAAEALGEAQDPHVGEVPVLEPAVPEVHAVLERGLVEEMQIRIEIQHRLDHDLGRRTVIPLSLIHISEPTRLLSISYAVFCLKKKNQSLTNLDVILG
eukprot:TRINITY_DN19064_c0_g1_i1.p3 TRINITY_DN19064_c0_g1~~TRINITY_DN19064_c0_g1_i1.p3  ORF type:complete len:145 (-),score=37.25 TRINITY_DN19064_c0_g1_i1:67-501(-)